MKIYLTLEQLAERRACALRPAGIVTFCTGLSIAAQNYSPSGHPRRRGIAIIAYTVEDYRTPNDQFCTKTYVTACKMENSKIDPIDNTTRWVYDDLNRVIEQVNQFDDENARASRTTPRDGTATWHAARSPA